MAVVRALNEHIERLTLECSTKILFPKKTTFHFCPTVLSCDQCGGPLHVLKSNHKTLVTMDIGAIRVKETILHCPMDWSVYCSEELRKLAPMRATFGFDVLVYVGKALFIGYQNNAIIIEELARKNISISDQEIAYLGKKFITYLALCHKESVQSLKEYMARDGGYILHSDGTREGDSPHLFTGIDELSSLVLGSIKLPSEKADRLVPFFREIKENYGNPIALVNDMGKGILSAIKEVFPHVAKFIRHFHFLRDLGKDLLEKEYSTIRNTLKKYRATTSLREQARGLEKTIHAHFEMVEELKQSIEGGIFSIQFLQQMPALSAYVLIHWALELSDQLEGYGFPFDRKHFVFYQNLQVIHSVLKKIRNIHIRGEIRDNKAFHKLFRLLDDIIVDQKLTQASDELTEQIYVFDQFRKALCIALPGDKRGLNDDGKGQDIKLIEKKVKAFRKWITSDPILSKKEGYQKMLRQIDQYWEQLFADPIWADTPTGRILIQPQRTNNLMERFFRNIKHQNRKKTGTSSLTTTMRSMLANTPLVKNLENLDYLKIILDENPSLEERFAKIDHKMVLEELKREKEKQELIPAKLKKIIERPDLPQEINLLFASAK